jgi:hypothetical protein
MILALGRFSPPTGAWSDSPSSLAPVTPPRQERCGPGLPGSVLLLLAVAVLVIAIPMAILLVLLTDRFSK